VDRSFGSRQLQYTDSVIHVHKTGQIHKNSFMVKKRKGSSKLKAGLSEIANRTETVAR